MLKKKKKEKRRDYGRREEEARVITGLCVQRERVGVEMFGYRGDFGTTS